MSNIVQFVPSQKTALQVAPSKLDDVLASMSELLTGIGPMSAEQKKAFMGKLKGILRSRGVVFRCSPPPGSGAQKNRYGIFFANEKVAFFMGLKKKKVVEDGWVYHHLQESSVVDAAGQIISLMQEVSNEHPAKD